MTLFKVVAVVCAAIGLMGNTAGAVTIEAVPVGDPGNAGELSGSGAGGEGPDRICGAVSYAYQMGKYEVTAGQYCEFLNAVAKTDAYLLYNVYMDYSLYPDKKGCNIKRSDSPGNYSYSVAPDWANRPANWVSSGDAARFANWLHNGQPTGSQDLSTTEDGSYYLNGATSNAQLLAVTRKSNATWVIPTEDEWYKAAYNKNDGVTGEYFYYPTRNDDPPSNTLGDPNDPGNNATYVVWNGSGWVYTIGSPNWRTEVGAHENSDSPYGTFDQGGNVWEWNEAAIGSYRGLRGGGWYSETARLHSSNRGSSDPTKEDNDMGFRVAKMIDSDGDGVRDPWDQCPNTIPSSPVDADGCPPLVPADFERDGDVDQDDFTAFEACASGPGIPRTPGCEAKDFDQDNDVDQSDFGIFQRCYSGENVLADPNCGN